MQFNLGASKKFKKNKKFNKIKHQLNIFLKSLQKIFLIIFFKLNNKISSSLNILFPLYFLFIKKLFIVK